MVFEPSVLFPQFGGGRDGIPCMDHVIYSIHTVHTGCLEIKVILSRAVLNLHEYKYLEDCLLQPF